MQTVGLKSIWRVVFSVALAGLVAPGCTGGDDDDGAAGTGDASVDEADGAGGAGELPQCEGGEPDPETCLACVRQGLVQGKEEGQSCAYLGIPYARPPVGELRWTAPEPAEGWSGTLEATAFGAACMQGPSFGNLLVGGAETSEDCLFINVWTPATLASEALPVMVFIYGGGYTSGATNTYPGGGLSESGPVVVVSMNYRVAALGFFAHPDLDSERPDSPSGSDGIRDQQLALQWVRDNIAFFGGDPDNVTVFGESAGSSSVCIHMVSPLSSGLAERFIMESGTCLSEVTRGIEPLSRQDMYALTGRMADDLCPGATDVIGCLRALPAEQVTAWTPPAAADGSTQRLDWVPVIEGPGGVLPEHPDALLESGNYNEGEIIIGTNKNEYALFQMIRGGARSMEELRSRIESSFGDGVEEILALYAPDESPDPNQAYVDLMTDVMFRCGSRRLARMVSEQGGEVYLYSFERGQAMHASELAFVFYPSLAVSESDVPLSDAIQGYWTGFAADGDPNGEGRVAWPLYDIAGDRHLILADPVATGSGWRKSECDFWDSYLAGR